MKIIVIGAVAVLVALIIAGVVIYVRNKRSQDKAKEHGWAISGDLNKAQETKLLEHNAAAETIFKGLLNVDVWRDTLDLTILSTQHKKEVAEWLKQQYELSQQITRRR